MIGNPYAHIHSGCTATFTITATGDSDTTYWVSDRRGTWFYDGPAKVDPVAIKRQINAKESQRVARELTPLMRQSQVSNRRIELAPLARSNC